ncbi:geranylgeranyl pyrophosphate synthase-like [Vanessa cardui]|uniref:geranylgeranyl pyrophosphate synthase-like n=1 Tax=Vanessa cardui TaxID=171605 RepID=UPI001F1423E9|nr:geranylgeranyl pyrophosphate synthase-like [Vanessa cardui]
MEEQKNFEENGELFMEKELLSPHTYLLQISGKKLRVKSAMAFNHWLQIPYDKMQAIVDTVNSIHVGTLLVDDIQDDARIRRGLPAAHCVYGIPLVINTSVHVVFAEMEKAAKICPKGDQLVAKNFLDAVRGQGLEIYWRDRFMCPTEEQFRRMVEMKTGGLFMMVLDMIQSLSENKTDYSRFALLLAYYFQIRDDYCNISHQEALEDWPGVENKLMCKDDSFCEDITEGKFTLMIIHAMRTEASDQIMNILRQRTRDINLKKYFVSLLENAGSLKYTQNVLSEVDRKLRAEIARFGGNPMMVAVLDELLSWKS